MQVPFNVAYGNSAGYNYASGRLDWQTYFKNIQVDRSDLEIVCLEPVLRAWHSEAILVSDFIPVQWRNFSAFKHQWSWDGREHVDPAKEANAQDTRLKNHSTNHAIEYSKQGKDWQTELRQSVKELHFLKQLAEEFDIPFEAILNFTQNKTVTVQNEDEE
jgi:capsid protein